MVNNANFIFFLRNFSPCIHFFFAILSKSACNGRENCSVLTHNKKNLSILTWELSFLLHSLSVYCLPFWLNLDYVWSNTTWATVSGCIQNCWFDCVYMECTMWTRWMNEEEKIHFILAFFKLPTEWVECSVSAAAKKLIFHNGIKMLFAGSIFRHLECSL